jgi:hypothetical protein
MRHTNTFTGDQLANALQALGIRFLIGGNEPGSALDRHPARLIAALAESAEARLRLSLIPLFLEHPEFAAHVRLVCAVLSPSARLTLQCYYSAAVWLQQQYRIHLPVGRQVSLPDIFSRELGLEPTDDPQENLARLAARQQVLSGASINWLGTYQHAAQIWLKGLKDPEA